MADEHARLLEEIASVARALPATVLEGACAALEALPPTASRVERLRPARRIVQPSSRQRVRQLLVTWQRTAPTVSPPSLAWALRAASAADEFHRQHQTLELVWTGPAPPSAALRRTDQALLGLIEGARRSLIIVTFAAYKIPQIAAALKEAATRGVAIRLILESPETSDGKVAFAGLKALGEDVARMSTVYVWPLDRRPRDAAGRHGSLHVKCAVADENTALISSANLTEHALQLNMELGVLIRGGELPGRIAMHLERLIGERALVPNS